MNAIRSHCTNRLLLVLGALLCAGAVSAQEARLTGSFTSGGFRGPSEAESIWSVGAEAGGEKEWPDLVLHGHFGFTQDFLGGMCGSMFTRPGYYPVDVLEFTPGSKSRQTYDISGGLAWKKWGRWIPSLDASFRGVNYAKRKDLRHTTYRQELGLSPSITFKENGWSATARYTFGKNSEFIQAEQVGPARAESYYAFLDKGLRYGTYQAWDGSGIHLSEAGVDRFPVNEITHGLALELVTPFNLEAAADFSYGNGEVGEKGYTWFRFPTLRWNARAAWRFNAGNLTHRVEGRIGGLSRQLWESVIEKVNEGGVTTPSILGANRVYAERCLGGGLSYRMERPGVFAAEALIETDADIRLSTLMYPFWDLDQATHFHAGLQGEGTLGAFLIKGGFLMGGSLFGRREIMDSDDDNIGVSIRPTQLRDWYDMESELDDALRLQLKLTVRYNFKAFYLEAGCDWTHAFGVTLLPGADRQTTHLTLGYRW